MCAYETLPARDGATAALHIGARRIGSQTRLTKVAKLSRNESRFHWSDPAPAAGTTFAVAWFSWSRIENTQSCDRGARRAAHQRPAPPCSARRRRIASSSDISAPGAGCDVGAALGDPGVPFWLPPNGERLKPNGDGDCEDVEPDDGELL
jgi:hypothetical protein